MIKKLIRRWRDRRAGAPRELWGMSLDDMPVYQWGGWNHTVVHCSKDKG